MNMTDFYKLTCGNYAKLEGDLNSHLTNEKWSQPPQGNFFVQITL